MNGPFVGFSMILRELRLMDKQPGYRFILLCALVLAFIGLFGAVLLAIGGGLDKLHRLGLF